MREVRYAPPKEEVEAGRRGKKRAGLSRNIQEEITHKHVCRGGKNMVSRSLPALSGGKEPAWKVNTLDQSGDKVYAGLELGSSV